MVLYSGFFLSSSRITYDGSRTIIQECFFLEFWRKELKALAIRQQNRTIGYFDLRVREFVKFLNGRRFSRKTD